MNIWTFKRSAFAVSLILGLAACEGDGTDFLEALRAKPGATETSARPNVALVSATMAQGAIKLTPPDGYCIDRRDLSQSFAVMARCDRLGAKNAAQDAPLGLILAEFVAAPSDVNVENALQKILPADARILEQSNATDLALAQVRGGAPSGSDPVHWRGLTQIGGNLMSFQIFAPQDGELTQGAGQQLARQLVTRTRAASADPTRFLGTGRLATGLQTIFDDLFN
ncbi:MAG: hypothetical protein AB8B71_11690 [Paracoccaceae bacterium]